MNQVDTPSQSQTALGQPSIIVNVPPAPPVNNWTPQAIAGVTGLGLSVITAVVGAILFVRNNWLKFRYDIEWTDNAGLSPGAKVIQIDLHQVRGPDIRVDRIELLFLQEPERPSFRETQAELKLQGFDTRLQIPKVVLLSTDKEYKDKRYRPVAKGQTVSYYRPMEETIWPWELVNTRQPFAFVKVYIQNRVVRTFDVSGELRDMVAALYKRRNGFPFLLTRDKTAPENAAL